MAAFTDQLTLLRVFLAAHVATQLADAQIVDVGADPREAFERLTSLRFDQAPVVRQGHVAGWVRTKDLEHAESVKAQLRTLEQSAVLSADAPISSVIKVLAQGLVFLVDEHGISGFVTPSDLDKHAARSHFYLLISSMEMLLADIVQLSVREELIVARIRGDELMERWTSARSAGSETRSVEYLYVKDLAELFLESSAAEIAVGWDGRRANTLVSVCHLRPRVMHPTRPLVGRSDIKTLAALAEGAEELITQLSAVRSRVADRPATDG